MLLCLSKRTIANHCSTKQQPQKHYRFCRVNWKKRVKTTTTILVHCEFSPYANFITTVTMRKQSKLHNKIHLCNKLCYRISKTSKMLITSGRGYTLKSQPSRFKRHLTTPCKNQPVAGALAYFTLWIKISLPSVGITQRKGKRI